MLNFQEIEQNRGILLYSHQNLILLRRQAGEMIGRATPIANNYGSGLTAAMAGGSLYYAYLATDGSVPVRSVTDRTTLYQLPPAAPGNALPQLCVFRGRLLLFYFMMEETDGDAAYRLCCVLPGEARRVFALPEALSPAPALVPVAAGDCLLLHLYGSGYHKLIHIDEKLSWMPLRLSNQEDAARSRKLLDTQQQRIRELTGELAEKDAAIRRLTDDIESATRQYNELMQVAQQYRDEARKWASKFR